MNIEKISAWKVQDKIFETRQEAEDYYIQIQRELLRGTISTALGHWNPAETVLSKFIAEQISANFHIYSKCLYPDIDDSPFADKDIPIKES